MMVGKEKVKLTLKILLVLFFASIGFGEVIDGDTEIIGTLSAGVPTFDLTGGGTALFNLQDGGTYGITSFAGGAVKLQSSGASVWEAAGGIYRFGLGSAMKLSVNCEAGKTTIETLTTGDELYFGTEEVDSFFIDGENQKVTFFQDVTGNNNITAGGQFRHAGGSAEAPAYGIGSHGMYSTGSSNLSFAVEDVLRMSLSETGMTLYGTLGCGAITSTGLITGTGLDINMSGGSGIETTEWTYVIFPVTEIQGTGTTGLLSIANILYIRDADPCDGVVSLFFSDVTGTASTSVINYTTATGILSFVGATEYTFDDDVSILGGKEVRFSDVGNSNYVGFKAPALTANQIWTLPTADGNADEIIKTDGSGVFSFVRMPKAIYAELSDSTDQVFAVAGTHYSITFNTNDEISGITHSVDANTENITIITTGVYTIFAQPQVAAAAGPTAVFHMWLQRNTGGEFADIANTNIELSLTSNDEDVIPLATTFALDSGDIIRLRVVVSDNRIGLDAQAAVVGPPTEPAIPSIIFTMFMIGT